MIRALVATRLDGWNSFGLVVARGGPMTQDKSRSFGEPLKGAPFYQQSE
jgi:hypothetical protein